jgi:Ca2+-binding EF-hand superfamily protein
VNSSKCPGEYDNGNANEIVNSSNASSNNTNLNIEINTTPNSNSNSYNNPNNNRSDIMSFDEFCVVFQKIYENSQNPEKVFLEGYAFLDQNKKGYIDIEDLKNVNKILNQHFSEDDLEGNYYTVFSYFF